MVRPKLGAFEAKLVNFGIWQILLKFWLLSEAFFLLFSACGLFDLDKLEIAYEDNGGHSEAGGLCPKDANWELIVRQLLNYRKRKGKYLLIN